MQIKRLLAECNIFELFRAVQHKYPDAALLDSGTEAVKQKARYSIIAYNSFATLSSKGSQISISGIGSPDFHNPFDALEWLHKKYHCQYKTDLPFIGGLIGYMSYDLCHHLESISNNSQDDLKLPDLYFSCYHGAIIQDHLENKIYLSDAEITEGTEKRLQEAEQFINQHSSSTVSSPKLQQKNALTSLPKGFHSNLTKAAYLQAIAKIKQYILDGRLYQVNMTHRIETTCTQNPLKLYQTLRHINPAPYGAYIRDPEQKWSILSSSPERFLQLRDRKIETKPIKGTIPRGNTAEQDKALKQSLIASQKDRAELLMIVDLERNDLGRVAEIGSIKVPELFSIESYPSVHHLVSKVTATLASEYNAIDLLRASFPGGSITGAPKISSMKVIDELEPNCRSVYTGIIGYLDFNGNIDFNIAIRTLIQKQEKVYLQVGGGIVWDSVPEQEYNETLDKAKLLIAAIQLANKNKHEQQ